MVMMHHDSRDYHQAASEAATRYKDKLYSQIETGRSSGQQIIEKVMTEVPTDHIVRSRAMEFQSLEMSPRRYDVGLAFELIDVAVAAGVDAIKFQTFRAEKLVTRFADKATYQKRNSGAGDQFTMLKGLELRETDYIQLAEYCRASGIEFLSTPFDYDSALMLKDLGCRRIKIPSGELTNTPLLEKLAALGLPILLSTGMANMSEVVKAVGSIQDLQATEGLVIQGETPLTVLHCTSSYPTALSDVNLAAMTTMADQLSLPVGYSDHTDGICVAPIAVALGAKVYEKHFTMSKEMVGPDHKASLEPSQLKELVRLIRQTEVILGSPVKQPTADEMLTRVAARRSVAVVKHLERGHVLTYEDLTLLRPNTGISPSEISSVVGKPLARNVGEGETLQWQDIIC